MCVSSVQYASIETFAEQCVDSIQLRGIRTFWSIRTFWLKIVHEELV